MSQATPGVREPNWDMTPYFPEPRGQDYQTFVATLARDLAALAQESQELGTLTADGAGAWARLLGRLEYAHARLAHLASYLGCLSAADARDEAVQAETGRLARLRAEIAKAYVNARAALGAAPAPAFERLLADPGLADAGFFLYRLRERAAWSMEPELERLVAELDPTGLSAWGRLYDQVSGRLEFELAPPGRPPRRVPVSMTRTLLEDPDAAVRRAALTGSNAAWEGVADVVAACFNAISGTRLALYRRRGIRHFLDPALFDAAISRRTLDAMLEAVTARQEIARRYLRTKARFLGRERLGFQDRLAPLSRERAARVPFDDAREQVLEAFARFHPPLAGFATRAFEGRWIDWEPRPAKRPGGFCSSSPWIGESRVFLTFDGAPGDVSTLAHELGHAFHAWVMRDQRFFARRYPMTLAETASTFAEQVLVDARLAHPDTPPAERLALLDAGMQDAAAFLLDIPARFHFEHAAYEEREQGELSVSRLKDLMLEAQRHCYGDALAEDELDPWFWASKLHFYITGLSFYNFPYTFGYLFSLGIFARAREEGAGFLPRYEALLRLTGSDAAEAVARRVLGVDLGCADFWNASLDRVEEAGRRFEAEARERLA